MYNNLMMNRKGNEMGFEKRVLEVVETVTNTHAYFFQGTMFLETEDSKEATQVYSALHKELGCGIIFGLAGQSETYYDFV
jgi:hypothetical protein